MEILFRDVRDPRIKDVVVTGVEVSSDLWSAKVYVQLSGTSKQRSDSLAGLTAAQGFIRSSLSKVMRIRRTPDVRFFEDESFARVKHIEDVLDEIKLDEDGVFESTTEDNEE